MVLFVVTDGIGVHAFADDALQIVEGTAGDKEDVFGVDLDELLLGVLAPALRGHIHHGALQQLEQRLLHTLAGDIARDGRVVRTLAGDLVDFIDEDDATLGLGHVIVGGLQQAAQDALHILAHIAGFREDGGVGDAEGHVQQLGDGARQQRLSRAGLANHQDVRFLDIDPIVVGGLHDALVVVIDGHGDDLLGLILPDDVVVELGLDLARLHKLHLEIIAGRGSMLLKIAEDVMGDMKTIPAHRALDASEQEFIFGNLHPAKGAYPIVLGFLGHYLFSLESTWSIMPYSLASEAIIQWSRSLSCHTWS